MQKDKTNRLIYSASDLVNFTLCPSITLYDLQHLETPLEKAQVDPYAQILQEKGIAHETRYLDRLKKTGRTVADIAAMAGPSIPKLVENTISAMSAGTDVIFQACLHVENRIGHIDFLEKVDKPSRLGRHAYEVTDTKLSRKAAPKHIIQLCFYAELLEHFQGTLPEKTRIPGMHALTLQTLKKHPAAHIYHYGHYEETALKNLMSEHGTREFQVDQLLRNHKLVDLYKVVRQGLRISESSYSLKKVENFYMEKRDADVVSAVESVIFYEKWKLTRDPAILDSIRLYNEDDCRSTYLLHTWLLSIKPAAAACFFEQPAESVEDTPRDSAITEYEQALALSRARSLAILIANPLLLEIACNTVEQMRLINTLCRGYYAGKPVNKKNEM